METNDEAGAVAAAQYFLSDLYDYMYRSGDTTEWAALAADDCSFCNSVLGDVQAMTTAGQSDSGSDVQITGSRAAWVTAGELYSVWVSGTQGASERRDGNGVVVSTGDGGPFDLYLAVGWSDGWVIRAVDVITS